MLTSAPVDVTYFRAYINKPIYNHGINDTLSHPTGHDVHRHTYLNPTQGLA